MKEEDVIKKATIEALLQVARSELEEMSADEVKKIYDETLKDISDTGDSLRKKLEELEEKKKATADENESIYNALTKEESINALMKIPDVSLTKGQLEKMPENEIKMLFKAEVKSLADRIYEGNQKWK